MANPPLHNGTVGLRKGRCGHAREGQKVQGLATAWTTTVCRLLSSILSNLLIRKVGQAGACGHRPDSFAAARGGEIPGRAACCTRKSLSPARPLETPSGRFAHAAERFDHYSRTWAGWQHSAFLIQAVACSMAQAAYTAMVNQARQDLAKESGGRSAFGCSGGVMPPSPRNKRP